MYGKLVPKSGDPPIPLMKKEITIGRRTTCDITLPMPTISGKHCELMVSDGYWYVKDLDSRNGIKVNGSPVTKRKRLIPGDVLTVATYDYVVKYSPSVVEQGNPGSTLRIVMVPAVICPKCESRIRNDGSKAGKTVKCPHCGKIFQMPSAKGSQASKPSKKKSVQPTRKKATPTAKMVPENSAVIAMRKLKLGVRGRTNRQGVRVPRPSSVVRAMNLEGKPSVAPGYVPQEETAVVAMNQLRARVKLNDHGSVKEIGLGGLDVTDSWLAHLERFSNLEYLDLSNTQITDAGLVHLKKLTQIEYLYLDNTQLTDAGLEHLKNLTRLNVLELNKTQVTDAGLVHLRRLVNLEFLFLRETKVTSRGAERLRKTLPNLEITLHSGPKPR